jgi:hypothetical protein
VTSALPTVESLLDPKTRFILCGYDAAEDSAILGSIGSRRRLLIAARGIERCSVRDDGPLGALTLTVEPDGFRLVSPQLQVVAHAFAAFENERLIAATLPAGSSIEAVGLQKLPALWDRLRIDVPKID